MPMPMTATAAGGMPTLSALSALLVLLGHWSVASVKADIDYNTINEDGSFRFRHTNDDIGGYYHSAAGGPDKIVRGRYGSRNPATGVVDEVVYTAGPRGFRVNGPKIHRKMDLAQYPVRPRGAPDDPLADPYDVPTYSFNFRTNDQSRSENSDATGRVRGLYSYIDDVGERHSVRYAAGAGTGFEVSNAVPDSPATVGYTAPLYKAHPQTRGRMTVQRGPSGSYKLIAAGPDHRRAESRGTDGLVRGTYSFLDDRGVQRTVEYIAGAGIGYRVVQNRVGPGTHINPSVADFRLSDSDFRLASDFGRGVTPEDEANGLQSSSSVFGRFDKGGKGGGGGGGGGGGAGGGGGGGGGGVGGADDDGHLSGAGAESIGRTGGSAGGRGKIDRFGQAGANRGGMRYGSGGSKTTSTSSTSTTSTSSGGKSDSGGGGAKPGGRGSNRNSVNVVEHGGGGDSFDFQAGMGGRRVPGGGGGGTSGRGSATGSMMKASAGGGGGGADGYSYERPSSNNYNFNDDDVGSLPPLISANRRILEVDRERDWVERHRDSTVIKNVGKWYIGLPPGQSVRAHVQNIDLLPLGGRRVLSPSEALRQDEIAEMVASFESEAGGGGGYGRGRS